MSDDSMIAFTQAFVAEGLAEIAERVTVEELEPVDGERLFQVAAFYEVDERTRYSFTHVPENVLKSLSLRTFWVDDFRKYIELDQSLVGQTA